MLARRFVSVFASWRSMTIDWSRLFSSTEFRWQMGLRAGDVAKFFSPTEENASILTERRSLLDEAPAEYAALVELGRPLLEETRSFAEDCAGVKAPEGEPLLAIGRSLEPDFVVLAPSEAGPVVVGGVVCFPSAWSLPEKLGKTLEQTHGPVPALNPELGQRIRAALDRLAPGVAWERDNWGLSRDGNRDHHPRLTRGRLDETIQPEEVWIRIEHQVLYRLPSTGGLLFGIRLSILPLLELVGIPQAIAGLRRSLESMPPDIAAYKGLERARERILSWVVDQC